jgi:hypothetical protein
MVLSGASWGEAAEQARKTKTGESNAAAGNPGSVVIIPSRVTSEPAPSASPESSAPKGRKAAGPKSAKFGDRTEKTQVVGDKIDSDWKAENDRIKKRFESQMGTVFKGGTTKTPKQDSASKSQEPSAEKSTK